MILGRGDPLQFLARPISLAFVLGTALLFVLMAWPALRRGKRLVGRLSQ
jgi:TctA family transporter